MTDVLVLGDIALDVVVHTRGPVAHATDTDAHIRTTPGGAGANVAAGLAREGLSVTFVGCVGDDGGRDAGRALGEVGVDRILRTVPGAATGTVVVLVDEQGERSMAADRGANLHLRADDVPEELLRRHRHLHVSGYALFGPPRGATLDIFGRAQRAGLGVSLDPASVAPLRAYGVAGFLADTGSTDLLLPNADEARALTGCDDPHDAAALLATHHRAVAVTCGADGAVWAQDGEVHVGRAKSGRVVDTVGAGDAFAAGALAALLSGAPPRTCLDRGLSAAARCVSGVGAPGWSVRSG